MVVSKASTKLRESISAFVPVFLSHRTQSRVPPSHNWQNFFGQVEYLEATEPTGTDPVIPTANGYNQHQQAPLASTIVHGNTKMLQPTLSRTHTSSSTNTTSTKSSRSRRKRPQYYKTRPARQPRHTRKPSSNSTRSTTTHGSSKPYSQSHSERSHTRPRRKVTAYTRLRVAVASKFRLTLSFTLAFLAALFLYLGLFLSHTSSGVTFHVLSILLLLALLAIALHSFLRFWNLNREFSGAKARRAGLKKTPSARGWNISRPLPQFGGRGEGVYDEKIGHPTGSGSDIGMAQVGNHDENDGFPIFHAPAAAAATNYGTDYDQNPYGRDVEANAGMTQEHSTGVRYPPPVYGNTRTSVRLSISPLPSPTYAHPPPVPPTMQANNGHPSITAPTNANLAPGMPGWHPPSFRSEGGITAVLERRRNEVQERLGGVEVLGRARYEPSRARGGGPGEGGMI